MSKSPLLYPLRIAAHFFVAVASGLIIGGLMEATVGRFYANTIFEGLVPCVAMTALMVGLFVSYRIEQVHLASWTWTIGLLWFSVGVRELTGAWDPRWAHTKTAWAYAQMQLIPHGFSCHDTECLYFGFYTVPFVASLAYSIGGFAKKAFRSRR